MLRGERHARHFRRGRLRKFARRAYRRPVSGDEVDRLAMLAESTSHDWNEGMRAALTAMLSSPSFLLRDERHPAPNDPTDVRPLDAHALATRLSYFLWSSCPDEELSRAADDGSLLHDTTLDAQVARMLDDPRADSLVTSFARRWLRLDLLDAHVPDPDVFPGAGELRASMLRETEAFVRDVFTGGRDVRDLLGADDTFVDAPLARHYGIPGIAAAAPARVRHVDPLRGGLLGHASILTMTSYPTRTSAAKRGKWVLETLLGDGPPPPPPGVGDLEDPEHAKVEGSLRTRLEQHRNDPACASCHRRIDPVGFALESFDAIGRTRTHDGRHRVDPAGVLPDGRAFDDVAGLRAFLRDDPRFVRHLAAQLLVYATGRAPIPDDERAVDAVVRAAAADGYRLRGFVRGVVHARPFRFHRGDAR